MKKYLCFVLALSLSLLTAIGISGCSEEVTVYHLEIDDAREKVSALLYGGAGISPEEIDAFCKETEYLTFTEDGIEKSGADGNRVEGDYYILGNRIMVTWQDGTKNEFIIAKDSLTMPPEYMRIELKWTKQ